MPTFVVSEPLNESSVDYLRQRGEVIRTTPEEVHNVIGSADGLVVRTYTQVNDELLDKAPNLKVVGRAGVALENIDIPACRARGVEVVHTPAANTLAVVDYTMRMIIELNRRFPTFDSPMEPEEFHQSRKFVYGRFLSGATLGIVGAGRIGSRVGRAAVGLGMKVLYNDILDIELDYPAQAVDKDTLYAHSDIVTIHVPLTDRTEKFINAESLAKFKPGAQFINCARGQCVDYAALAEAMKSGAVSAAAVDCHDPEPPKPNYPMFGVDNAILTPHIAARVPDAVQRMCDVVHDVVRVLEGERPEYPAPRE
ncbi:MAG: NAD(P)-dependent oxidoreductase [Phycisphaerae bacterium]